MGAHTDDGGTTAPTLEDLRSHRAELLAPATSAGITVLSVFGVDAVFRSGLREGRDSIVLDSAVPL